MNLTLSLGTAANPRTWPIFDGSVKPDGIDLVPTIMHPSEMFWRQLRFGDFDVSEMSMSSLMMAVAPATPAGSACRSSPRGSSSTPKSWCAAMRGIERPADLRAGGSACPNISRPRRYGTRGALQHEFGVQPDARWNVGWSAMPTHSHAGAVGSSRRRA